MYIMEIVRFVVLGLCCLTLLLLPFCLRISLLEVDVDYWKEIAHINDLHARNIEHIYKGEPTESYEGGNKNG